MPKTFAASLLALSLLLVACGGGDDDGADAGEGADGSVESREEAIAQCMALSELTGSVVPEADCCFVDEFTGEDRDCDTNTSHTATSDDADGCVYSSEEVFSHPDGDYIKCTFTACQPCE